jgi:acetyltransferase
MAIKDSCNKCEVDRIVMLHQKNAELAPLPRPALRPYPSKYVRMHLLKDGTQLRIRPIRPEDEPELVRFHATLSEHSVYLRYFSVPSLESRTRHERLTRICFIDYDRDLVLVAELMDENVAGREIVGVGRLGKLHLRKGAEVAAVVSDEFQRRGVGRALIRGLIEFARDENVEVLRALVLAENKAMRHLLESEGFLFVEGGDLQTLTGELPLLRQ